MRYICLWSFKLVAWILWSYSTVKIQEWKWTKDNNPKSNSFELWFFCTALLLNRIHLSMKFHVDALNSFKVMLRTKKDGTTDWRTDWLTDGRVDYYMPTFGGIKRFAYLVRIICYVIMMQLCFANYRSIIIRIVTQVLA